MAIIKLNDSVGHIKDLAKKGLDAKAIASALYETTSEDVVLAVQMAIASSVQTSYNLEAMEASARPKALEFLTSVMEDPKQDMPVRVRTAEIIYKGRGVLPVAPDPTSFADRFRKVKDTMAEVFKERVIDVKTS